MRRNERIRERSAAARRAQRSSRSARVEILESRLHLSASTTTALSLGAGGPAAPAPSHVVIVMEEDRGAGAIGDTANMPYFNQLAATGLVFNNSHGLNTTAQEGEMNYLALYSGSTQGVTDNGNHGTFSGANLAQSLASAGLTFSGYSESLPYAGDTTDSYAASPTNAAYDDLYVRAYNPMAQFTNVGAGLTNASVNKTFASFPTSAAGFAALPAVSIVVPNTLHNTHGSNDTSPYATDPTQYNFLRQSADTWLKANLDAYVQWAKQNNSLLIVTDDEADRAHNFAAGFATIINGSTNLFVPGSDSQYVTPYNILRTVESMYGLPLLGNSSTSAALDANAAGKLGAPASSGSAIVGQTQTFAATITPSTATGSVQFLVDGTSAGAPVSLNNGYASQAIAFSSAGQHLVTAVYSGSSSFAGSASPAFTETVTPAATSLSLVCGAQSLSWGQGLTLTANVSALAPGGGTPSGTITFFDAGQQIGAVPTDAFGNASFNASALAVGVHSFSASFASTASYGASASAPVAVTVSPAPTTLSLSVSSANLSYGQGETLSVSVACPTATASGSVAIYDGATLLGSVMLDGNGAGALMLPGLSVGSHALSASYAASANFGASSASAAVTVLPAATATTLSVSATALNFGQNVTLTATVTAGLSAFTPSGMVAFFDGTAVVGVVPLDGSGTAAIAVTAPAAGGHAFSAAYQASGNFAASSSTSAMVSVTPAATSVAMSVSAAAVTFGQGVTLTAQVSSLALSSAVPSGTVTFYDGAAALGAALLDASGRATFAAALPAAGTHAYAASYGGAPNFTASASSAQSVVVSPAATTLSLNASASQISPGQTLTLTALISASSSSAAIPDGVVQFYDAGAPIGSQSIDGSGTAALNLTALSPGTHTFTASYPGSANYASSGTAAVSVTVAAQTAATTTTSLSASAASLLVGQGETLTAAVAFVSPGSSAPAGTVVFYDAGAAIGSVGLDATGSATLALPSVTVGAHSFTATYTGGPNASGSSAPQVAVTVAQGPTLSTLSLSALAVTFGQGLTLNAAVAPVSPAAGTPGGAITFYDGGMVIGSQGLDATGAASLALAAPATGSHSFTASYAGDANFLPSSAPAATAVVSPAATAVALSLSTAGAVFGQGVSLRATVTATTPGAGTPAGAVSFMDGSALLGTATLNASGVATLTTSALAVAGHSLSAGYAATTNYAAASSSAQILTVSRDTTTAALSASATSIVVGQSVTLTARLSAVSPGSGTPTGLVTFFDGTTSLGSVALNASATAALGVSSLPAGSHSLTASYAGDSNFAASASSAAVVQVNAAGKAPSAPTTFAATHSTYANKVVVTWGAASGATAYDLWRATKNSSAAAVNITPADLAAGTTSYSDTNVAAGIGYWYWITAKNAAGSSAFSSATEGWVQPANDNFANATAISGKSVTVTGTNFGASKETNEPRHAGNAGGASVWWVWTAPASGTVTINTHGSAFDTLLAVYTGSSVGGLTLVPNGANDDDPAGGTTTSRVTITVTAGTTYHIAVDGYGGASGNITLALTMS